MRVDLSRRALLDALNASNAQTLTQSDLHYSFTLNVMPYVAGGAGA
jgi:hypothetical protein